jgi:addiction module RelE/StbE family toxin
VKVTWSDAAESDLASVLLHIAADDKVAALKLVDKLETAGRSLENFPMRGRIGRCPGTRELVVPGTSYILVYEISGDGIEILRAVHGAQDWPP